VYVQQGLLFTVICHYIIPKCIVFPLCVFLVLCPSGAADITRGLVDSYCKAVGASAQVRTSE
jgi:hypothetical protein